MGDDDDHVSISGEDAALLTLGRELCDTGYHFTTVTPLTQARVNRRPGNEWAETLQDVFGWSRPFKPGVVPRTVFDSMSRARILVPCQDGWRSSVRLSNLRQRLFFHSAYPTLSSNAVFFGPDTVRFANAIGAHLLVRRAPIYRAVDVGCGAGPGGILIAGAAPSAEVLMTDVNADALRLSRINAALNGATNATALRSDILDDVEGDFDLIVSNPPYLLDAAERAYRHGGGSLGEGLSLAILDAALTRLRPGGTLLLYTGTVIVDGFDGFRAEAERRLAGTDHRHSYFELDPDVFGEELGSGAYAEADRIAAVVLTVTREA